MSTRVYRLVTISAVLVGLVLAFRPMIGHAASAQSGRKPSSIKGLSPETFPFLSCTQSTQIPARMIAGRVMGLPAGVSRVPAPWGSALTVTFTTETSALQLNEYQDFMKARCRLQSNRESYRSLAEGQTDVILVSEKPTDEDLKIAGERKFEFDARPFALDALVFLVNSSNRVSNIKLDKLRDIYTGKVTKWSELGGKDEAVKAFTRKANTISQTLMQQLVLRGEKMIDSEDMTLTPSLTRSAREQVSVTPNGIGYAMYYYQWIVNPSAQTKLLGINGVVPTSISFANGRYPLVTELYIVTQKGISAESPQGKLRDWLLGPEGQKMVAQCGLVPISKRLPAGPAKTAAAPKPAAKVKPGKK